MWPQVILRHTILRAGHSPGEAGVAETPGRRVAHFSRVAKSRVASPRLGATRPTMFTIDPFDLDDSERLLQWSLHLPLHLPTFWSLRIGLNHHFGQKHLTSLLP